jgi:hypothetical protein
MAFAAAASRAPGQISPCSPAAASDDVLRQIFLLLDSPADLARACAASPTFRRIITDPCFLRRFHALHPPPLLGINGMVCGADYFLPAELPHPSAAAARELVKNGGIDFSCRSFLSPAAAGPWYFCDSRDGRVLRWGNPGPEENCCGSHRALGKPLAVCDPLHRRYLVLPAIPQDLAALVDHRKYLHDFTAFLAPPAEDEPDRSFLAHPPSEGEGESSTSPSYRVMCLAQCATKMVLFIFSSRGVRGQQWRATTFEQWGERSRGPPYISRSRRSYVHGRFYWPIYPERKKVLVLDARWNMPGFSMMGFPPHVRPSSTFVEAAGERERLAMVTVVCRNKDDSSDAYYLEYSVQGRDNEDYQWQWETEASIGLPLHYLDYRIMDVAGGYLLLQGTTPKGRKSTQPDMTCFSLDLRTLRIKRFCGSETPFIYAKFYAGCPPYLSSPTV